MTVNTYTVNRRYYLSHKVTKHRSWVCDLMHRHNIWHRWLSSMFALNSKLRSVFEVNMIHMRGVLCSLDTSLWLGDALFYIWPCLFTSCTLFMYFLVAWSCWNACDIHEISSHCMLSKCLFSYLLFLLSRKQPK